MTEAEWLASSYAEALLEWCGGASSLRKLRLFACACCRDVWEQLWSRASWRGIEVAEAFADGLTGPEELERAQSEVVSLLELYPGEPIYDPVYWACRSNIAEQFFMCLRYSRSTSTCIVSSEAENFDQKCDEVIAAHARTQSRLVREIFGNPFRPVRFDPAWRTDTALTIARQMYDSREFGAAPILADALQDAGCDADDLLNHLRDPHAAHVRGCWALDLVLGKA
jgi:hypothetical protein